MEKLEVVNLVATVRPAEREAQEVRRLLQAMHDAAPRSLHPRIQILMAKTREIHTALTAVRKTAVKAIPRYNKSEKTEAPVVNAVDSDEEFAKECREYTEKLANQVRGQQQPIVDVAEDDKGTQFVLQLSTVDMDQRYQEPITTDDAEDLMQTDEAEEEMKTDAAEEHLEEENTHSQKPAFDDSESDDGDISDK